MKLVVIAPGRKLDGWVQVAVEEYGKRLRRHLPFEVVLVKDAGGIEARIPPRARVVALDERGKGRSSGQLAASLQGWMSSGVAAVTFVLGDADGLPEAVRARADETLSLSPMTLPHRMALIVIVEQLYRALSIVRGEPYHRA